jgi:hypothetical protein
MNFAMQQRLRLIDFLLDRFASFNRGDIADYFGVAPGQVTRDVAEYMKLAPGNTIYDASSQRYVRLPGYRRIFP